MAGHPVDLYILRSAGVCADFCNMTPPDRQTEVKTVSKSTSAALHKTH